MRARKCSWCLFNTAENKIKRKKIAEIYRFIYLEDNMRCFAFRCGKQWYWYKPTVEEIMGPLGLVVPSKVMHHLLYKLDSGVTFDLNREGMFTFGHWTLEPTFNCIQLKISK